MLTLAKPEDGQAVSKLFEACFVDYVKATNRDRPGPYPWMAEAIEAGRVYWIGARQGAVVVSRETHLLQIDQIGIALDQQGQGVGALALDALENMAREEQKSAVTLYTAQPMTRLVAFYSRAGYRVDRTGPSPYGADTVPRVFMSKKIS